MKIIKCGKCGTKIDDSERDTGLRELFYRTTQFNEEELDKIMENFGVGT